MYTIMLVEDEAEIRNGLKVKVDWESLGFRIAAEADNGQEALALLEERPVDVLISDIRMPKKNGMDLAAECVKLYPGIKIVLISGYEDFEYAQKAIKLGVADYLLKPVTSGELTDLMERLKLELDRLRTEESDRELLKRGKELERERLLLEWVHRDPADLQADWTKLQEQALSLDLAAWLRLDRRIRLLTVGVIDEHRRRDLVDAGNALDDEGIAGFLDPSYPGMAHFWADARRLAGEEEIRQFISRVCAKAQYRPDGLIVGAGKLAESFADIRQSFHSSLIAWANGEAAPGIRVVVSYNVENLGKEPAGFERKLLTMIETGEEAAFRAALSRWLAESGNTYATVLLANRVLLVFESAIRKHGGKPELLEAMWECQQAIRRLDGSASIRDKLLALGLEVIRGVRAGRSLTTGEEIAGEVKSYIDENLDQELNLADISRRFHINPSYLSEVFKKIAGQTFTDYLTEVRLRRAETLLSDPSLKLSDIALMSGFSNISYFSTVFKKHYGEPPTEYRFKMIGSPDKNRSD